MSFTNLWGLLFLLAIPAIIIMHMLQRKQQKIPSSTLFLLDKVAPISRQGSRFDKLKNSLLLWMQILCFLFFLWLALKPMWVTERSVLKMSVVIDSSLSMQAFKGKIRPELERQLRPISKKVSRIELHIISSSQEDAQIYNGAKLEDALNALDKWLPTHPGHSFLPALRTASSLNSDEGLVFLVSDQKHEEIPDHIKTILIGDKISNVGFAGVEISGSSWKALIKNYSNKREVIELSKIHPLSGLKSPWQKLSLKANELKEISGSFPKDSHLQHLQLSTVKAQQFVLDDSLYIIREQKKVIHYKLNTLKENEAKFFRSFFKAMPAMKEVAKTEKADLEIHSISNLDQLTAKNAIFYFDSSKKEFPENFALSPKVHPLLNGLNWMGQKIDLENILGEPDDNWQPLLWYQKTPLCFLHKDNKRQQVLFRYSPFNGNAFKKASSLVLLQRFIENIRQQKKQFYRSNFESHQLLGFEDKTTMQINGQEIEALNHRAPFQASFFSILRKDKKILEAASHFSDISEADFRKAETRNNLKDLNIKLIKENSEEPFFLKLFYLLLFITLGFCWYLSNRQHKGAQS